MRKQLTEQGTRQALKRIANREELRLSVEAEKLIHVVHQSVFTLFSGMEEVDTPEGKEVVPLSRDRIAALKAASDISHKMLGKILPDLKQVELTDADRNNIGEVLQDIELDNRLRIYLEAKTVADAEFEEVVEEEDMMPELKNYLNESA